MPFLGKTPTKLLDANVNIDGGNIDGTTIGAASTAPATVSTFTSTGIDDNATSTAITIDSSENVGIGTASPDGLLNLFSGSAGAISANTSADELVIEGSGQAGLSILTPNTSTANIFFGDSDSATVGRIRYDHSANALSFWTDNVQEMTIDSSGNVGIGTTSPTGFANTALHIADTSNNAGLRLQGFGETGFDLIQDNASTAYVYNRDNGPMLFATNDTERMRIDASGNVGIGTSSPSQKLEIDIDGTSQTAKATGGGQLCIAQQGISSLNSSGGIELKTSTFENGYGAKIVAFDNGDLVFGLRNNSATFVERLRIDRESGNVGIGTTSPSSVLTAVTSSNANNIQIRRNSTTTNDYAQLGFSISTGTTADNNAEIRAIRTNSPTNGDTEIAFLNRGSGAGPTERMRLSSSGNVGIGTSSPSKKLELAGTNSGNTSDSPAATLRLTDTDTSTAANQPIGKIEFYGNDGTVPSQNVMAYILSKAAGTSGGGDLRFGVCANTAATEAMRIDSSGNVGIGTSSPSGFDTNSLVVESNQSTGELCGITISNSSGTGQARLRFAATAAFDSKAAVGCNIASNDMFFETNGSERMRIDSSGNLLIGTTVLTDVSSSGTGNEGAYIKSVGQVGLASSNDPSLIINRKTTDGDIALFRKDGTTVGSIGVSSGDNLYITGNVASHAGFYFGTNSVGPLIAGTLTDNVLDLGSATYRFDDIYATNGTIQTSDANEKQDIEALSEAETRVAVAAKALLRKFRWKSAVEEKGDDARIHFGIIAQDLKAAFEAEGLDAGDYAMFIHSTWTDEETGEERSRMGVRYSELLAFIIAAI